MAKIENSAPNDNLPRSTDSSPRPTLFDSIRKRIEAKQAAANDSNLNNEEEKTDNMTFKK